MLLSWPSLSAGFKLQQNADLTIDNWVTLSVNPAADGTNRTVTITPAVGNRFFRLKYPERRLGRAPPFLGVNNPGSPGENA